MIQQLEEGHVPGRKAWKNEGKNMRVTVYEFQRLKEYLHDGSFMAERGMWHLMEQWSGDARKGKLRVSEH